MNPIMKSSSPYYGGAKNILQVLPENPDERQKNKIKKTVFKIIGGIKNQLTEFKEIIAKPLKRVGAPEDAYNNALGDIEIKLKEIEELAKHETKSKKSFMCDLEALNEQWSSFAKELEVYDYALVSFPWEPILSNTPQSIIISKEQLEGLNSKLKSMQMIKEKGIVNEAEKYIEELESKIKFYGPSPTLEELNRFSKRLEGLVPDYAIFNQIKKSKIKEEELRKTHKEHKALWSDLTSSYQKVALIIGRLNACLSIYSGTKKIKEIRTTLEKMHEAMDRLHTDKIASGLPENGKTSTKIEFGLHQEAKNDVQVQLQNCSHVQSDIAKLNESQKEIASLMRENNKYLTQLILKIKEEGSKKSVQEGCNKNIQSLANAVSLRDSLISMWNHLYMELYRANLDLEIFLDFINVIASQSDLFLQCASIMQEMRFNRLQAADRVTHFNMFNMHSKAYEGLCSRVKTQAIHSFYQDNIESSLSSSLDPSKNNFETYINELGLQQKINHLNTPINKIEELVLIANTDFTKEQITSQLNRLNRSKAQEISILKKKIETVLSNTLPNIFKLAARELNATSNALMETNPEEMRHLDFCFTKAYSYQNVIGQTMHWAGQAVVASANNALVKLNASESPPSIRDQHIHKEILSPFAS